MANETNIKLNVATRVKSKKNVFNVKRTSFDTMEQAEQEGNKIWEQVRRQRRSKIAYVSITYKNDGEDTQREKVIFTSLW